MAVNLDKPQIWKADVAASVDMYNRWFMTFAPKAFRDTRLETTKIVELALKQTSNLTDVSSEVFRRHPSILSTLRMSTCPPIAVDRIVGLSGASKNLVKCLEEGKLPPKMPDVKMTDQLNLLGDIIKRMADTDIFVWLERQAPATPKEIERASTIVADRLCGAKANPIIRNAQEKRQLSRIADWLNKSGYKQLPNNHGYSFDKMPLGTYSFRTNITVGDQHGGKPINIPIDAVIMRKTAQLGDYPLLIEAKSAGDFTNTNKRRKEEAQKVTQLRAKYGPKIEFILFLCGYFNPGYLGYEAAEGIDWVWEHRIADLAKFSL